MLKNDTKNKRKESISKCPYCDSELKDEIQNFCSFCKVKITYCKKCGSPISNNIEYCPNCGEKL